MKNMKRLVNQFRVAIDVAKDEGEFYKKPPFDIFPCRCCGDASDLLAQFLLENNIRTLYVQGTYRKTMHSHAWLLAEDKIIIDITGDQFKREFFKKSY